MFSGPGMTLRSGPKTSPSFRSEGRDNVFEQAELKILRILLTHPLSRHQKTMRNRGWGGVKNEAPSMIMENRGGVFYNGLFSIKKGSSWVDTHEI